ncbi:GNAT family N-acetyltransferase [Paractinoplanes rishiriensis]|uniref:Acetyltransferase n=1 Tax=Paractinoplanes rishiriensis TaxID=1050105 RepID=A0A919JWI6_9ACTN|nr:GNAT family N-acetyltransferase [Actinoplanes rishiriensis]GIE94757.1 acetyltransferase [Actinoplanes rishiriensis]
MPELIAPTVRLHAAWLDARDDWGRGVHQDGSGIARAGDLDSADGFAQWVDELCAQEDPATPLPPGMVHSTYRWIVENDRVLGAIALRHELTESLLNFGGHIGYGVRPAERRRGLASWALGETLRVARKRGLDRVLITCRPANEASRRTIERAGGVFEDIRGIGNDRVRRYWIGLS